MMAKIRICKAALWVVAVSTAIFLGTQGIALLVKHLTGQYPFPVLRLAEIAYFVGLISSVISIPVGLFSFAGKPLPRGARRYPLLAFLAGLLFVLVFFVGPVVQSLYVRSQTPEPWMTEGTQTVEEPQ